MTMTYEEAAQFAQGAEKFRHKRTYYAVVGADDIGVFLNALGSNPSTHLGTIIVQPYYRDKNLQDFTVEWEVLYEGNEPVNATT